MAYPLSPKIPSPTILHIATYMAMSINRFCLITLLRGSFPGLKYFLEYSYWNLIGGMLFFGWMGILGFLTIGLLWIPGCLTLSLFSFQETNMISLMVDTFCSKVPRLPLIGFKSVGRSVKRMIQRSSLRTRTISTFLTSQEFWRSWAELTVRARQPGLLPLMP